MKYILLIILLSSVSIQANQQLMPVEERLNNFELALQKMTEQFKHFVSDFNDTMLSINDAISFQGLKFMAENHKLKTELNDQNKKTSELQKKINELEDQLQKTSSNGEAKLNILKTQFSDDFLSKEKSINDKIDKQVEYQEKINHLLNVSFVTSLRDLRNSFVDEMQKQNNHTFKNISTLKDEFKIIKDSQKEINYTLHINNIYRPFNLSLANNVPISLLTSNGFRNVYQFPYSHSSTNSEIDAIRNRCSKSTTLCVGGADSTLTTLYLVSCGNCLSITQITTKNNPVYYNNAYWYRTPDLSFGFSPLHNIHQSQADIYDYSSNLRLSWHLDINVGGWRLGSIVNLNSNSTYFKMMFVN